MLQIFTLILAVYLIARGIIWLVQRYHDARGCGSSFKNLLREGKLDASVYADAVWSEVERFGKRRLRSKIAKRQRKLIRKVKNELRASYLSACTPSLYQIHHHLPDLLRLRAAARDRLYPRCLWRARKPRGTSMGPVLPSLWMRCRAADGAALGSARLARLEDLLHLCSHRRRPRAIYWLVHATSGPCAVMDILGAPRSHLPMGCLALPCHVGPCGPGVVPRDLARAPLPHR